MCLTLLIFTYLTRKSL
ncbi:TPA: small toxic polypeptide, partial [Klebsiella pneumoniae]